MPAIAALTQKKKENKAGRSVDSAPLASSEDHKQPQTSQASHAPLVSGPGEQRELCAPIVQSFEVEDGDRDLEGGTSSASSCRERIFPCDCCCCIPAWCDYIPGPFRTVQGWTHMWLLVGTIVTCLMVVWNTKLLIDDLQGKSNKKNLLVNLDFWQEAISMCLIVPCIGYFVQTIKQYDQDLAEKRREVEMKRQELMDEFRHILSALDDYLGETLGKTLDSAESGFECKQREFSRFLEELAKEWGASMNADEILGQLRRFCLNWFLVFQECSIDPLDNPRLIAKKEQLEECRNLGDICELVTRRFQEAQDQFIMCKKKQDQDRCKEHRKAFEKLTTTGDMLGRFGRHMHVPACCRGFTWIRLGCCLSKQEVLDRLGSDGTFPMVIGFGCGQIILLNLHHIIIIGAFLGFLALVFVEVFLGQVNAAVLGIYVVVLLCLGMVLMKFEDIDLVSQLMREIQTLKKEKDNVSTQNEKMREEWARAQTCTDIWIYRTLPRLTLYSEVQTHFDNASMSHFQKNMELCNDKLESLEKRLPALREWRNDGGVPIDQKREFRSSVGKISATRKLDDMLVQLSQQPMPWEKS